jgi:hypothetical protein
MFAKPMGAFQASSIVAAGGVTMVTWFESDGLWGHRFALDGTDLLVPDEDFRSYRNLVSTGTRFVGNTSMGTVGFIDLDGGRGPLVSLAFDGGASGIGNLYWAVTPIGVGDDPVMAVTVNPTTLSPVSAVQPWYDFNRQITPVWLPASDGGHVLWIDTAHGNWSVRARSFNWAGVPGLLEELRPIPDPLFDGLQLSTGGPRPLLTYGGQSSMWADQRPDGTVALSDGPGVVSDYTMAMVGTPQGIYMPQRLFFSEPTSQMETFGAECLSFDGGWQQFSVPLTHDAYQRFQAVARPGGVAAVAGGFDDILVSGSSVDVGIFFFDGGALALRLDAGIYASPWVASAPNGFCVAYPALDGPTAMCLHDDFTPDRTYRWSSGLPTAAMWDGELTYVLQALATDAGTVTQWHQLSIDGGENTWASPQPFSSPVPVAPGRFVQIDQVPLDAGAYGIAVRATFFGIAVNGTTCTEDDDCRSGFCVDGACCDSRCGGGAVDCLACSIAAGGVADGVCLPIPQCIADAGAPDAGSDRRGALLRVGCGCSEVSPFAAVGLCALVLLRRSNKRRNATTARGFPSS